MATPSPTEWNNPSSGLKNGSIGLIFQFIKPTTATAVNAATTSTIKNVSSLSSQSKPIIFTMVNITTTPIFTA